MNKLHHLTFIMDGNNRWSVKKNTTKYNSYKYGAEKLLYLSKNLFEFYDDLDEISAFALSSHNLKRPKYIINIIKKILLELLDNSLQAQNINYRLCIIGDLDFLDKKIIDKIKLIESQNLNSKKKLNIFLNYSGQQDIINSVNQFKKNKNTISKFTFEKNLSTKNLLKPDILIRTGGYNRISDFMLYEIAFTELFFLKKLWPEINLTDIKKIINKFNKIERKFGI